MLRQKDVKELAHQAQMRHIRVFKKCFRKFKFVAYGLIAQKKEVFQGHQDVVYSVIDGLEKNTFYSAGGDGKILAWHPQEPKQAKLIVQAQNSIYAQCLIPEIPAIVVAENNSGIHLIDLSSKQILRSMAIPDQIFDLLVVDHQIWVATGSGKLYILSWILLHIEKVIDLSTEKIRCLAKHPSQDWIVAGCSDGHIYTLNQQGQLISNTLAHLPSVFTLAFHSNGELISAGRDAHIKKWQIKKGVLTLIQDVAAHLFAIHHLCFHPQHAYFASCSLDKTIKIWSWEDMRLLQVLDRAKHAGHGTAVNKLLWLKQDNLLISCSDDRTCTSWFIDVSAVQLPPL